MLQLKGLRAKTLQPVDLTLPDGQCIAIMGASGSGKSLLLRAVADLDPHDGDVLLDSRTCASMAATEWRRLVTYVPAESGWWADTVADHFADTAGLPERLGELGLSPELARAAVSRLSTGERQRLALLRALRADVRVMLLDEPTSGLDETSTGLVEAWLAQAMHRGLSLLLVTHSPAQAARLAERRLLLRDARLIEQAP